MCHNQFSSHCNCRTLNLCTRWCNFHSLYQLFRLPTFWKLQPIEFFSLNVAQERSWKLTFSKTPFQQKNERDLLIFQSHGSNYFPFFSIPYWKGTIPLPIFDNHAIAIRCTLSLSPSFFLVTSVSNLQILAESLLYNHNAKVAMDDHKPNTNAWDIVCRSYGCNPWSVRFSLRSRDKPRILVKMWRDETCSPWMTYGNTLGDV